MKLASHEVTIAAPAAVVWTHLTTAEGLVRWVGPEATADPVPGGELRWTHPNGATVVGRFVELVPHRRVVFTYGWEDGRMGVPPESTTVEIDRSPFPTAAGWGGGEVDFRARAKRASRPGRIAAIARNPAYSSET